MLKTIGERILTTLPALIGVIIVSFLLTRVLPGDTAAYFAGPGGDAAGHRRNARSSSGSTARCPNNSRAMSAICRRAISANR